MTYPHESLREDNHYVLLLPSADEQFLTRDEMREFLAALLVEYPDLIDSDLRQQPDPMAQAQRLMDTTCSLELSQGETVQWYAVRLNK